MTNKVEHQEQKPAVRLNLVCLADVKEEEIEWLWMPYLPVGKITILEGDPDSGKSFLSLALAAPITTGRPIPFGVDSFMRRTTDPRNVLMLIAEDGAADTVKPRFRKVNGDMKRLTLLDSIIRTVDGEDMYSSITLSDIPELETALQATNPALCVIDPFQAFLGAKIDLHRSNETRPVLFALSKLAEQYRVAIMLIRHLKKGEDKAIKRGLGSIDISAAARSILLAGRNPQPPDVTDLIRTDGNSKVLEPKDRFVVVHTKCNLDRKGRSILYSIDDSGLTLDGTSEIGENDLLNAGLKSVKQDVDEWLEGMLASGAKDVSEIKAAAAAKGFGRYKLKGAVDRLGVKSKPSGFGGAWLWELPPFKNSAAPETAHTAHPETAHATSAHATSTPAGVQLPQVLCPQPSTGE